MKYWPYLFTAVMLPTLLTIYIISLGYTSLTEALWVLPNETEILLFTVFAGLGAATIGHFLGYRRGEKAGGANIRNQGRGQINFKYIILILAVVALFVIPFFLNPSGEFGGTDGQGPDAIEESGYEPWIEPLGYLPGDLGERLLFSSQVGIGGAIFGFWVGNERGKRSYNKEQ